MIERLTKNWVQWMIRTGVIERERAPLYAFGMEQGLRTLLEIILMLATGIVLGLFWQGVVMMTTFCLIRVYAGGYHAKTPMQCAIKSWIMFTAFLVWLRFCPSLLIVQISIITVAGIFLVFVCPLADEHKPLQEYEIPKYRKRSLFIYFIEVVLYIIGIIVQESSLSRSIACGMGMLLVVWGVYIIQHWWKNRKRNKN